MQVQSQLQLRFKVRNDYLSKLGTKGHSNLKPNTIQSYGQSEIQRLRKKDHLKLFAVTTFEVRICNHCVLISQSQGKTHQNSRYSTIVNLMQVQSQLQLRFEVRNDYLSKLGTIRYSKLGTKTM